MTSPLIRSLLALLSPAGRSARLSILIFHRVLGCPDPLFPGEADVHRFEQICSFLKAWCNILPLSEAVERLQASSLPARAACITFDDGYADNYRHALPILDRHGLHATFFIATGFLDGGRMWNDTLIEAVRATEFEAIDLGDLGFGKIATQSIDDKRAALKTLIPALKHQDIAARDGRVASIVAHCGNISLPSNLMMTSTEIRALHAAGMGIGAHTANHPILALCEQTAARNEISEGRATLKTLLGERIGLFAYPNGKVGADYTQEHVDMVQDLGFDAAVSTNAGASGHGDDAFQLSRFTPWDREAWRFGLRLARNLMQRQVA